MLDSEFRIADLIVTITLWVDIKFHILAVEDTETQSRRSNDFQVHIPKWKSEPWSGDLQRADFPSSSHWGKQGSSVGLDQLTVQNCTRSQDKSHSCREGGAWPKPNA